MWKPCFLILSLAVAPVFGQIASSTLTITANRSVNLLPDQVAFTVYVSSSITTSLDQIVAGVSSLGITSANLTGISSSGQQTTQWDFTLAVPIAKLAATIGSLTKLQQNIGQNNSGLTLTFYVEGTQVSQEAQQLQQSQPCSNSELIADATAQAQKLAAAAGLTLGPILKLSTVPLAEQSAVPTEIASFVSGPFAEILFAPAAPQSATCSLAVQFQLQP
jgi:Protein of unknown function (DUF541)